MERRRTVLMAGGAALAAAGYAASWAPRLWEAPLELRPLAGPEGFRRLSGGAISAGTDPLAGMSGRREETGFSQGLCAALFGPEEPAEGTLPAASFSDYNCPYCRVMTRRVAELAKEMRLRVHWHELPLLGEGSRQAARGALAAAGQDRYAEFHERLMRTSFRPTPAYLVDLGESVGLDTERMLADMQSEAITEQIRTSAALARRFGIVGTPALVVGRTLVEGEVDARTLRRLIARERAEEGGPCA